MTKFTMQPFGRGSCAVTFEVPHWKTVEDIHNDIHDPKPKSVGEICGPILFFHRGRDGSWIEDLDSELKGDILLVYATLNQRAEDWSEEGPDNRVVKWDIMRIEE